MALPHPIQRLLGLPANPETRPATTASPPVADGFQSAPHSRRTSLGWRIAVGAAVALVFFTGLMHLIVLPVARAFAEPAPPPPPVQTIDVAAAASLAAAFTADYWSYDSANPDVRATALAHWSAGLVTFDGVEGTGQLRADTVTPGAVATAGADLAVVQTRARVTPATLADGGSQPDPLAESPTGRAADPGPISDPWIAAHPRWLSLDVVVVRAGNGLAVTAATLTGGAELGDTPTVLDRPTAEVDTALTADATAEGTPEDLFGAYAAGDAGQLDYLTARNVHLSGLSSSVALADVTGWSIAADRTRTGTRYVTADVTWQLAGTDLHLTQPYALTLTNTDGRWLLGSIGPRTQE